MRLPEAARQETIREFWESWLRECLLTHPCSDPIENCRQSFVAGACAVMGTFSCLLDGDKLTADQVRYWHRLRYELLRLSAQFREES